MRMYKALVLTSLVALAAGTYAYGEEWNDMPGTDCPQMEPGRFGGPRERGRRGGPGMEKGPRQDPMARQSMMMHMLMNPRVAESIGIEEEQIDQIRKFMTDVKKKEIELWAEKEIAGVDQVTLLMADKVDEEALMNAVEKSGKIQTELAKLRVRRVIELKKILSPEQLQKVKAALHERRHRQLGDREEGEERRWRGRGDREGEAGKRRRGPRNGDRDASEEVDEEEE